jgi:hypothetical protein
VIQIRWHSEIATHEFLRTTVTQAAGNLQKAGLINYHRGHITVLNRAMLEKHVCECYAVVKKEYDRLLSASTPS